MKSEEMLENLDKVEKHLFEGITMLCLHIKLITMLSSSQ